MPRTRCLTCKNLELNFTTCLQPVYVYITAFYFGKGRCKGEFYAHEASVQRSTCHLPFPSAWPVSAARSPPPTPSSPLPLWCELLAQQVLTQQAWPLSTLTPGDEGKKSDKPDKGKYEKYEFVVGLFVLFMFLGGRLASERFFLPFSARRRSIPLDCAAALSLLRRLSAWPLLLIEALRSSHQPRKWIIEGFPQYRLQILEDEGEEEQMLCIRCSSFWGCDEIIRG